MSSDAARSLGKLVDGPAMLKYWRRQSLGQDGTGIVFKWDGARKPLVSFASKMLRSNMSAAEELLNFMQSEYHEHTLGPFVNYQAVGPEYDHEHGSSWLALKEAFQENLYDKVFNTLQDYLAPHSVRFHPQLNVSGWPFRKQDYEITRHSPLVRDMLYVGAPPHRDGLWDHLNFDFCKCKPDLHGVDSRHTISYTLPLVLPEVHGGLRVWRDPKQGFAYSKWLQEFEDCHPRCNHTHWDFHTYKEGVLAVHSGQEYHSIGDDHIFETRPTDRRLTLQGHGVFCDGTWYLF